ncbi:hypothetical protein [Nocardia sp. NPDC046763]|uniref:GH39 family glycosyl hydrolase n=1 Tax=Nocardia sp. NPDC046763 TaxID=3155256 RepID=UPI0033EA93CC
MTTWATVSSRMAVLIRTAGVVVCVLALELSAHGTVSAEPAATTMTVHPGQRTGAIHAELVGSNEPVEMAETVKDASDPLMRRLSPSWVRTFAHFDLTFDGRPNYDCATGAWDSGPLDRENAHIRAQGAQPVVVVGYAPTCLNGAQPGQPVLAASPMEHADRWNSLVATMAAHEIADGVRTFEVWNEPDTSLMFSPIAYPELYADTVGVLEDAAAAAGVHIEVGGPALAVGDDPLVAEPFLAFVAARGLPLDFVSWHWYSELICLSSCPTPTPGTFADQVRRMRAMVARYPALHPKLWISEWNLGSAGDSRVGEPYGGAYAASALMRMQQAGLDRACIFLTAGDPGLAMIQDSGTRPGPQYEVMAFWRALGPIQVASDITDGQEQITALASTDDAGRVTVLLTNFMPSGNSAGRTTTVRLDDGNYQWTEAVIDAAHNGDISATGAGRSATLTMTANTTALLTFTPRR